jgi:hypothetical protein
MSRIFFGALLWFLLILPRQPWSGVAQLHTESARSLVARGTLDIASAGALPQTLIHDGRRFAEVPLGPTLVLAPVELPLALFARGHSLLAVALEALTAALAAALLCALFFSTLLSFGTQERTALATTAMLALATSLTVYARIPDGTAWAALLLLLGVNAARRFASDPSAKSALLLGAATGGLILFDLTAPALVLLTFALVFAEVRERWSFSLLFPALAISLVLLHKKWIGALPEPRGDLLEGLDGLLISTGKSIFLYSPPLVLGLIGLGSWWRTRRGDAILLLSIAASLILPVAVLPRWHGDPAWGPRRIVPLVPLLLLPAGLWLDANWRILSRARRAAVATLVAAGVFVQILGISFSPDSYLKLATQVKNGSGANGWFTAWDQVHYMPQFSPLAGHLWLLTHLGKPKPKAPVENPPWHLLQPATVKLELEAVKIDWWALDLHRDNVVKK